MPNPSPGRTPGHPRSTPCASVGELVIPLWATACTEQYDARELTPLLSVILSTPVSMALPASLQQLQDDVQL